ncbi:phage tail tube protein [Clostridium sp. 1001271B_151109_B4]|uniref:phage tail tube protein n=1 Tax=Clostridium sp. 1001271B_151109_B4 TaxID=2787148 RepID=UPI0018ABD3AB|nr:phage tail tube protein [Clostridium sp. 1001271B_151109_B4]
MLANGITLGYSEDGSSYTDLVGLQEVPEIGSEPEKVDATTLADKAKKYEQGIGDYGDLEFTFKYDNSSGTSPFRILKGFETNKKVVKFQMTFPDKTKFKWDAQVSVKIGGGGVNALITFTLSMALQSDVDIEHPGD